MAINIIDKNLSFYSNHSNRGGAPKGIVLHHAAGSGAVEDIHRTHKNRGYAGIGYHLYVRKDGTVYRGRPENWLGAHATGYNDRIGVCAEGNFETETMSAAQQQALVATVRYLLDKYGTLSIVGHRDIGATACPGKNYPFAAIVNAAKNNRPPTADDNLVRRFQLACIADGIALPRYGADGVWGAETEEAARYLLRVGTTGERVRLVQRLCGAAEDGIFGQNTKAAVQAFQTQRALAVDGIVGVKTWKVLMGV